MPHLRWTLEKFRIPLGKMLLVGEMFIIASLVEILDRHWESMLARCLDSCSAKRKRAFSLPLMERKRKARWRQTSLDINPRRRLHDQPFSPHPCRHSGRGQECRL